MEKLFDAWFIYFIINFICSTCKLTPHMVSFELERDPACYLYTFQIQHLQLALVFFSNTLLIHILQKLTCLLSRHVRHWKLSVIIKKKKT